MEKGSAASEAMDMAMRKKMERILPKQTVVAKVNSINRSNYTCDVDPVDGGASYTDVRLQAVIDENDEGVVHIPKIGSYVTVSIVSNNENYTYVAQYSEIDEFIYKIGDIEFSCDKDGVRIKKGNESFLTIIEDMIDELNKIIVVQGTTINVGAMEDIKTRFKQPLKA